MMSRLNISTRLIGHAQDRTSVRRMPRMTALFVSGTLLAILAAVPTSGTAGVLDRFRRKKSSTGRAAVTIPTIADSSNITNTAYHETADDEETGPTCAAGSACSDGECEHGSNIGFWRRMANKTSDQKRRWRRKMYFEYHFSNKRMLYPVCPPFDTANHGYFPSCWRQFPEAGQSCPPRELEEPSAADCTAPHSPLPQPAAPPSP